jgi:hypothetical protein
MSIKLAEDLGGVIVQDKVEFVSDPPQERKERTASFVTSTPPGSAISPLGSPQGLRAPIIALTLGNIRDLRISA